MSRKHTAPVGCTQSIRADTLKIDPSYQREIDAKRVARLASDGVFDAHQVRALRVSRRKDGDYLIDGQHTREICLVAQGAECTLHCLVFTDLTPEQEAQLFAGQDRGVVRVSPAAKHRALVRAKDEDACAIDRIATDAGLRLGSVVALNVIVAVEATQRIHKKRKNLRETIAVLQQCDTGKPGLYDGALLKTISLFLEKHKGAEMDRLVTVIKREGWQQLLNTIRVASRQRGHILIERIGCALLAELYNKGKQSGKLLDGLVV